MGLSTVKAFKHMNKDAAGTVRLAGEDLKRYQQYLLKITEDIIGVCEEQGIVYHLTGGTCLGAVRHRGFIPWDDDIDIDISGDQFDLFVRKFGEKYPDKYWIHTAKTHDYGMTVNRVRLKGSVFRGREDIGNAECGFFVDLLRMENVPDFKPFRWLHGFLCMGMGFLLSCRNFHKNRALMKQLAQDNPDFRKAYRIKVSIGWLLSVLPLDCWTRMTQAVYGMCSNSRSEYVSVPAGRKHYFGELRKRRDFYETTKGTFEGHEWDIPRDYDGYLRSMYGDYMKIPPEADREGHILLELKWPDREMFPGREKD